jgi:tyrosinase
LFLLHHGFIDKLWWEWQKMDPKRLTEIAGPNAQSAEIGFDEFPGTMAQEAVMFGWGTPGDDIKAITPDPQAGDGGANITLNHVLSSLGLIPDTTVAQVMDTKGGYFCYEY